MTEQGVSRSRRAAEFARSFHVTVMLALVVGVITGVVVAGFERVVQPLLDTLLEQRLWVVMVVPAAGLALVNVVNRLWGDGETRTTDAYIHAYHERGGQLGVRAMVRKVVLSVISLGSGSALGFEGPALLIGGTVGSTTERFTVRRFRQDDAKVLIVAGAAAGVAAIFKAPLTGVCFALEVPYRADLARRALPAALAAGGASYLTYVTIIGTEPLFKTGGAAPFNVSELLGGVALGLLCGVLARIGAWAIGQAKRLAVPTVARVAGSGVALAAAGVVANWWFHEPLHLGPSYQTIDWVTQADRSVVLLVALFALRAMSTWLSVAGGGVGGLFIPLVTQGAVLGALVQHLAPASNPVLFPTVGIAAFLGAGYRTPLAGVAFVAEATGQPGFLVPALLAAVAAQTVMGRWSFSPYQLGERAPDVRPLRTITLADIMTPNPDTIAGHQTISDVVATMMRQNRRWAPVVDNAGAYAGLVSVRDISTVPQQRWPTTPVDAVVRHDIAPAASADAVSAAAARMRTDGTEALAVVDEARIVGVVTFRDVANIEILLDRIADDVVEP